MPTSEQDGSTRTAQLKKKAADTVARIFVGFFALMVTVAVLSIVFVLVDMVIAVFEFAGIPAWQATIISVVFMFLCYFLGGFVKAGIEI